MNKKILIQFFLFSLFIFLSVFFYYEYFKKDSQILKINKAEKILLKKKTNDVINMISNKAKFR